MTVSFAHAEDNTLKLLNGEALEIMGYHLDEKIISVETEKISFTAKIQNYGKAPNLDIDYESFFEHTKNNPLQVDKIRGAYPVSQENQSFYILGDILYATLPITCTKVSATLYKLQTKDKTHNLVIINKIDGANHVVSIKTKKLVITEFDLRANTSDQ